MIGILRLLKFSSYRKGVRFERKVKGWFEDQGAAVFRCAGSKPLDLVVIWPDGWTDFVECKSYSNLWSTDIKKVSEVSERINRKVLFVTKEGRDMIVRIIGPEGIEGVWNGHD